MSLAARVMSLFVLLASTVTGTLVATGASSTAETTMLTWATFESSCPSFTLNSSVSFPKKFALGVYSRFGGVPVSVPFWGCAVTA